MSSPISATGLRSAPSFGTSASRSILGFSSCRRSGAFCRSDLESVEHPRFGNSRPACGARESRRPSLRAKRSNPSCHEERMDCFVASLLAMTALQFQTRIHDLAARCARGLHLSSAPKEGVGNAGCPLHPRPRVHFVLVERTRVTTSTPERPAFPHAMVLTAYVVLSPVTGLICHRRLRIRFCLSPVGPTQLRELDASVGASGPHDFAVRGNISRQRAWRSLTDSKNPPCDPLARKTLPRPPHPTPRP